MCIYIYIFTYVYVHIISIYLSVCLSICLSVDLSIDPSYPILSHPIPSYPYLSNYYRIYCKQSLHIKCHTNTISLSYFYHAQDATIPDLAALRTAVAQKVLEQVAMATQREVKGVGYRRGQKKGEFKHQKWNFNDLTIKIGDLTINNEGFAIKNRDLQSEMRIQPSTKLGDFI